MSLLGESVSYGILYSYRAPVGSSAFLILFDSFFCNRIFSKSEGAWSPIEVADLYFVFCVFEVSNSYFYSRKSH